MTTNYFTEAGTGWHGDNHRVMSSSRPEGSIYFEYRMHSSHATYAEAQAAIEILKGAQA